MKPKDKKQKGELEIRIPTFNGYIIWNKGLMFGEETPNEDLWLKGYGYRCISILGFKLIKVTKVIN